MEEEEEEGRTPGPWILRKGGILNDSDNSMGLLFIECEKSSKYFPPATVTRVECGVLDALLISAAPELLAALEAMHACHRAFSDSENWTVLDDEARLLAEKAIAKAKGEA